jgi:Rrf2 family protein
MKFSAQEEYGLRCLISIASNSCERSLTIPDIAEREGLTEPHTAKLLAVLRRDGFITSTRGQTGGYRLARAANQIVVGDVLNSLGGRLYEDDFCARSLWARIQLAVDAVTTKVTLEDVITGKLEENWVQLQSASSRSQKPVEKVLA